jgi:hypothetical protein
MERFSNLIIKEYPFSKQSLKERRKKFLIDKIIDNRILPISQYNQSS